MLERLRSSYRRLVKDTVDAVHDQDIETYLASLGILAKLQRGRMLCKFCRDPVTLDTLHSLFPQSGDIKVVCDKPHCVIQLTDLLRTEQLDLESDE